MADTARTIRFSSYPLTEDEYNALRSVRDQLGMLNGLLEQTDKDDLTITRAQLNAFAFELEMTLINTLRAIDQRYEATHDEDRELPGWIDWSDMLRFLAGRAPDHVHRRSRLQALTRRLQNGAIAEPDMRHVVQAWADALTQGHPESLDAMLDAGDVDDWLTPERLAIEAGLQEPSRAHAAEEVPDAVGLNEATIEQMLATASGRDKSAETVLAVMDALSEGVPDHRRQRVLSAYMRALEHRGMAVPELVAGLQEDRISAKRTPPAAAIAAQEERVASTLKARSRARHQSQTEAAVA